MLEPGPSRTLLQFSLSYCACRAFGDIGNIQGVTTRSQAAKDKVQSTPEQRHALLGAFAAARAQSMLRLPCLLHTAPAIHLLGCFAIAGWHQAPDIIEAPRPQRNSSSSALQNSPVNPSSRWRQPQLTAADACRGSSGKGSAATRVTPARHRQERQAQPIGSLRVCKQHLQLLQARGAQVQGGT